MAMTARRSAEITVDLPRDEAMALFTPEGERRWADGWDPRYPANARREGPGAVFVTEHGGHSTTWIMVDQRPDCIRYARVADGMTAGTIAVDLVGASERSTRVRVTYDLTALTPVGETWLESFEAGYDAFIESWSAEIADGLKRAQPKMGNGD